MTEIAGRPYWKATFDKAGQLQGDSAGLVATIAEAGIEQLFVFAHGWNSNEAGAEDLITDMFTQMAQAAADVNLTDIGFLGVFWPSIWFPEPPPHLADAVAAATQNDAPGQADVAVSGAEIAESIAPSFDPEHQDAVRDMGRLVDDGIAGVAAGDVPDATQRQNVEQFHSQLQSIVTGATAAPFDAGEMTLIAAPDPVSAYQTISTRMGSVPPGEDPQGLGDIFGKVWNGAKDALRVASYFEMKSRAGTVGTKGLGPLLADLHTAVPGLRVHLVGHSFGARLVSFALAGVGSAEASPVASLTLLQGAFSHWAFADESMPFGEAGPLATFRDRVHGPVLSTFSSHDWAVGIWYPKASFLAGDMVEAVTTASQWGGMGSDGAQWVPGPADPTPLGDSGTPYGLQSGQFYRFDSNAVISDTHQSPFSGAHSDIRHPQVSWLPVCAAAGL